MKTILEKVKLLNGNMPLSISLLLVCIFYIFGDKFFDIFSLFLNRTDYFEQLLLFGCYWFVQYFFVFFLRRSLFLKPIPSFGMTLTLYFVSYLVITGLAILFNTSAYGFLLFLSSWAWIIFFHKKNVYKSKSLNKPVIKENISNPRFWITLIVASLFVIGMGILIAWCVVATIFSITIPLSIENIFLPTLGVTASALLTFYSLIMLRYIIKYLYFGKLSEVEGTAFKKFIKTFLMTLLIYLLVSMAGWGIFYVTSILSIPILALALLIYSIIDENTKKIIKTSFLHIGIASVVGWILFFVLG